ncbi:hypothetical protein HWV62_5031 [Athelia sp. TMB]|nr:hypothetical protein HWV62_23545 [Athelia sp. TMB]KAF7976964.1 hypothetical protein HWV62_5031 [Athelia sp. TMB]
MPSPPPPRPSKDHMFTGDHDQRTIIVGDVHGSHSSLQKLLRNLSYDRTYDHLIHVGDVIAKGPYSGSMAVLQYMTTHNVTGVRGNHDQKVIEWRAWREWIHGHPGGKAWLRQLDADGDEIMELEGMPSAKWVDKELKTLDLGKWRKKIPEGWQLFSDHYKIARKMSAAQFEYLLSLPIILHVPSAHTYIVHAGLLPYDPTRPESHRRQPLAHLPTLVKKGKVAQLRLAQELAVLHDIPQNTDPWANLNIRSVDHKEVTKSSKNGTPWSDLWNDAMGKCAGDSMVEVHKKKDSMPCWPATVIYGHAASRGLDIKRWSFGTDSGCVYGRRLSALVLDAHSSIEVDSEDADLQKLPYGDNRYSRIVSVKCPDLDI